MDERTDKVIAEDGRYRVVHRCRYSEHRARYLFGYYVQCLSAYHPGRFVDTSGPWTYERTAVRKMKESIAVNAVR